MKKLGIFLLSLTFFAYYVEAEKKLVCYYGGWTVYRPGDGKFEVEDIDPFLCTHLMYSFVGLGDDSKIRVLDPWQELPDNWGRDAFGRFTALKQKNPKLKTLIAIGGWNEGSEKYSLLLRHPHNRKIFIADAIKFIQTHNFDGLDLDWEYPNQRGGEPIDVNTFTQLCKELREEFDKYGFLVTAAVAAAESSFSLSYDIPEISKYLHFINLMTYDFHGAWENITGLNAPLYKAQSEIGTQFEDWNVDGSVKAWIRYGGPPEKLVIGMPTYGRGFTLVSTSCIDKGCPVSGGSIAGPWTRESGNMGFNEICLKIREIGTQQFWDYEALVPYFVNGNQWIGYDNVESIRLKANYIKEHNLAGGMTWSIDTDDFRGSCGQGKYPLITTMRNTMNGPPVIETTPAPSTTSTDAPSTSTSLPSSTTSAPGPDPEPEPEPTSTSTTTTTDLPSSTTVGSGTPPPTYECKYVGYNRDEKDCSIFYNCYIVNSEYKFSRQQCAIDLYFDLATNVCNYKHMVECNVS